MKAECKAVIWHGPGHQSDTNCQRIGKHKVHCAVYGEFQQIAYWRGMKKKFTGVFDEPPYFKSKKGDDV